MQHYIELFKSRMHVAGISPPPKIIPDGRIHRFSTRPGSKDRAGWYVFHTDVVPGGCFGDWRTGQTGSWVAKTGLQMTSQEYQAQMDSIKTAKLERDKMKAKEQQLARERAVRIWDYAHPANHSHPYLFKKRITPFKARQQGDTLVLPIVNFDNKLQSLQFIYPDGKKKLLAGGAKKSHFIPITEITTAKPLLICEGFATGATLAAIHPDKTVIAAIDAGNLKAVAMEARRHWPHANILICADDDRTTPGNPGQTKAIEASKAAGCRYTAPKWPVDAPLSLSDFNDLTNWIAACMLGVK